MPASGPRLGKEPAASEGSGICPGIMSDPATTAATGERGREKAIRTRESSLTVKAQCCSFIQTVESKVFFYCI